MNTFEVVAFILFIWLGLAFVMYWTNRPRKREPFCGIKSDYHIRLQGERNRLLREAGGEFLRALALSVAFTIALIVGKWNVNLLDWFSHNQNRFGNLLLAIVFLGAGMVFAALLCGSFGWAVIKFYRVFEIGLMVCRLRKNPDVNAESEVYLRLSISTLVFAVLFITAAVAGIQIIDFKDSGHLEALCTITAVGAIGYFFLKGAVEDFSRSIRHRMAERIELQNTVLNMAKLLALLESGATAVDSDQIKKTREDFEVFRRRIENELPDSEARKKEKQR